MRWARCVAVGLIVVVIVYSGLSFCAADEEKSAPPVKIDEKTQTEHKIGTAPAVFMIIFFVGLGIADRLTDARKNRLHAEVIAQQYGYTAR